jgi:CDGSH-type Zn-finger protein/uncharacterized Fe-S cluster protein YjdI
MTTPAETPPSREQLLYWLHEAAEIEHHLMCCYLYAAFSLKRDDAAWTAPQREAVQRWRGAIMSVAFEEMTHLALVGNLAHALGGVPHANRPPFPVDGGPYPAGFSIRLQGFSRATIEHFLFLERPAGRAVPDGEGFGPVGRYRREVPAGRLSPGPRDYETVGELYDVIARSLDACAAADGEAALFIGDPALQVDAALAPLPGMVAITDLASARAALHTIVTQGEGAGDEHRDSHFCRFQRLGAELDEALRADPSFAPAWPVATNPVMNRPIHSVDARVHVDEPRIGRWLDIANALYTTSLRCLLQGFDARDRAAKATWLSASFALMRMLVPVGQGLAARPATLDDAGPHAGLTFTPLRSLARLPVPGAAALVAERLAQLAARAAELPVVAVAGESVGTWQAVIDALGVQRRALEALAAGEGRAAPVRVAVERAVTAAAKATASTSPPVGAAPGTSPGTPPAAAPAPPAPERADADGVSVIFDGHRCIHSRHCVLDAPTVFLANTPGAWIHPETVSVEQVVAVAHSCPSGAIRYERHDGGPDETAPAVNQLRLRENGPYALHAPLRIAGVDDGFRATLCRCGQSRNKPWCDGSHVAAGFAATGEPKSGAVDPLAVRDGPLAVTPMRDGPLRVAGNLEICAGTGRTVARVTEAALCRCGQSRNKPFCDLSHAAAGFVADGA